MQNMYIYVPDYSLPIAGYDARLYSDDSTWFCFVSARALLFRFKH